MQRPSPLSDSRRIVSCSGCRGLGCNGLMRRRLIPVDNPPANSSASPHENGLSTGLPPWPEHFRPNMLLDLRAMTKAIDILEMVAMGVSIGYCLICWGADLGQVGNMHPGVRCQILYPPGLVASGVGFAAALLAYRRRRKLALFTLAACALFFVWLMLPRL